MKKVTFTGKLSLNKETIAKLNDEQMSNINGGTKAWGPTLASACCGTVYCITVTASQCTALPTQCGG